MSKSKRLVAAGVVPTREDINRLRLVEWLIGEKAPVYSSLAEPLIALLWIVEDHAHPSGYVLTPEGERRASP